MSALHRAFGRILVRVLAGSQNSWDDPGMSDAAAVAVERTVAEEVLERWRVLNERGRIAAEFAKVDPRLAPRRV